jgi:hypothetical protein
VNDKTLLAVLATILLNSRRTFPTERAVKDAVIDAQEIYRVTSQHVDEQYHG